MDFLKNLKDKVDPALAEKTTQALKRAKAMAVEAGQKSSPLIKEMSSKAVAFAQQNAPVVRDQAKRALEDAIAHREVLKVRAAQDKAAHDEYVRTMYELALSPQDHNFLDEPFSFFERQFYFFAVSGEVLDTQKRTQTHLQASHSAHYSSGGFVLNGYGSYGSRGGAHMSINSHNTTEHEFWMLLDDGKEAPFSFGNSHIPMRAGQRLTLFFMRESSNNQGYMCSLYNHASGHYHEIMSSTRANADFRIYTKEPGWFDKQEVLGTLNRLLNELNGRLALLEQHAAAHHSSLVAAQVEADQ